HRVQNGQRLTFWSLKDPKTTYQGRVSHYAGAGFTLDLSPSHSFDPGTEWNGEIAAAASKGIRTVPTAALIRHGGAVYLPVRVSTGVTTAALTQITAGAAEGDEVLIIDDALLKGTQRHRQAMPRAAPAEEENPQPKRRPPSKADDKDDPYGAF
ncbi:MAG: hypothetical protein AAB262_12630, partial [Elusimicrobiota bacterium]